MRRSPKLLVFDSGLGGLTVFDELRKIRPGADFIYCADDAGFPYGAWREQDLARRVVDVLGGLIASQAPDMAVIACNTASTLALPHLRARWPHIPFVGTVPAIKVAAQQTQSKLISVLATPATVARDYTHKLIAEFAGDCEAELVGAPNLAGYAEAYMRGKNIDEDAVAREIAPCFRSKGRRRTDAIVLACTHYPLLLDVLRRIAPWPVQWIDPAPAIARRADHLLVESFGRDAGESGVFGEREAIFTSGRDPTPALVDTLRRFGLRAAMAEG
jgi:glutamate racemase